MVVNFFSGSEKTLKVAKKIMILVQLVDFFLVVGGQQKPVCKCNLESALLSNLFIRKVFIVQILQKCPKKLHLTDPVEQGLVYKHLYHSLINLLIMSFILCENIFKTLSILNCKSQEAKISRTKWWSQLVQGLLSMSSFFLLSYLHLMSWNEMYQNESQESVVTKIARDSAPSIIGRRSHE